MNDNNLIRCSQICVDCIENNQEDVLRGGQSYLGYNFIVKEEQTEEMKKFIALVLEKLDLPLINIYVTGIVLLRESNIWSKDRIISAIRSDADYLKNKANKTSFTR